MKKQTKSAIVILVWLVYFLFGGATTFAEPKNEAERLWELGENAYKESRFYEAINYYNKAISLYPSHSEEVAGLYDEIGLCYLQIGEYDKALNYFNLSLSLTKRFGKPEYEAEVYNHIGLLYSTKGYFDQSLNYLKEALKIKEKIGEPYKLAEIYNDIGLLYWKMGNFSYSLNYYEKALDLINKNNYEQEKGYVLGNIAMVYLDMGLIDKARQYFELSLKIQEKFNNPQDMAIIYNNLGGVYFELGNHDEAINYFIKSLNIAQKYDLKEDYGLGLFNVGAIYYHLGNNKKALENYKKALQLFKELNNSEYIVSISENIGFIYLDLKNYQEAERFFKKAWDEDRKKGSVRFRTSMVEFYIAINDYKKALEIIKEAPDDPYKPPYQFQLKSLSGTIYLKNKDYINSAKQFYQSVNIAEEIRSKRTEKGYFFISGGYKGYIRVYKGLVNALAEMALNKDLLPSELKPYGNDPVTAAFYFSELTKARTLLEAMAGATKKARPAEIPDYLKNREDELIAQLSYIDGRWEEALKKGESAVKELQAKKEGLKKELNSLINELRQKYPRYAALNYPLPVKVEEIPLREDEAIFEYTVTEDATYLFVVKKGGVKKLIKIPIKREMLEDEVKAFIEPMNLKKPDKFSIKSARKLYNTLLSEGLSEIKENEKIIIIPDGILGLLPFEALIVKEGSTPKDSIYVADRYTISYYQSATILAFQRILKETPAAKPLFAIGNPVYSPFDPRYIAWKEKRKEPVIAGLREYAFRGLAVKAKWGAVTEEEGSKIEFPPLPETETEVKEIAKIMDVRPEPPDILFSVMANEENLKNSGLEKYRYIHLATHASLPGMIQGINEPFILLSQVENRDEDGFLTLSEVTGMKLNADMVVLSACVTGLGKEVEGEGVANFARAFQQAGAKAVIVSLWEVASEPAVEYMKTFYSYLKSGKSRAEAIKLTRQQIKAKYPSPFYWAVFILYGEG